jgi:hypothetical protein
MVSKLGREEKIKINPSVSPFRRACAKNIKFDILIFSIFIFPLFFNHFYTSVFCFLYFFLFFAQAQKREKLKKRKNCSGTSHVFVPCCLLVYGNHKKN